MGFFKDVWWLGLWKLLEGFEHIYTNSFTFQKEN